MLELALTTINNKGKKMFTTIKNILLLVTLSLLITSCSTMNKSECLTADWRTIGFGDGAKGEPATMISRHRSACAEHGVTPNLNAYNSGRNDGLAQYCIPSTGYNKGLSGSRYNGICRDHNEPAFLEALNFGLAVHKEEATLSQMKRALYDEKNNIRNLKSELRHIKKKLTSGKLSELQRYKLVQKSTRKAERIGAAKSNLGPLKDDIYEQKQRVAELKRERTYR